MSLDINVQWTPSSARQATASSQMFSLEVACDVTAPVTGLFGPSGAGKSTLLELIAGLRKPSRGQIRLDRQTLYDADAGINIPAHRRAIPLVFQDSRLFPHLTVKNNLLYGFRHRHVERRGHGDRAAFHALVELLDLGSFLPRRVQTLSGGERQRVALGRALLSYPRFLLLDEPLASLDQAAKRQLLPYIRRVAERHAVPMLYVSHDIGEILQLTSQLLVLEKGRCVGHGLMHEVIREPQVFALAASLDLENILSMRIAEHLPESGLTRLELVEPSASASCEIFGPPFAALVGSMVTIAIRPEDIALAGAPVKGISIQNQIRGTVVRTTEVAGRALVEIDVGSKILAEVSRRSISTLNLPPGAVVYCLFKAHAVRCLDA